MTSDHTPTMPHPIEIPFYSFDVIRKPSAHGSFAFFVKHRSRKKKKNKLFINERNRTFQRGTVWPHLASLEKTMKMK